MSYIPYILFINFQLPYIYLFKINIFLFKKVI